MRACLLGFILVFSFASLEAQAKHHYLTVHGEGQFRTTEFSARISAKQAAHARCGTHRGSVAWGSTKVIVCHFRSNINKHYCTAMCACKIEDR